MPGSRAADRRDAGRTPRSTHRTGPSVIGFPDGPARAPTQRCGHVRLEGHREPSHATRERAA